MRSNRKKRWTPELQAEAENLRAKGLTYKAVGEKLGVGESSIYYWVNPEKYWGERASGRHRVPHLKRFYSISQDDYNARLGLQLGRCAICRKLPENCQYGILYVDHDHGCCPGKHSCGKCIRGLLCNDCNSGISRFKDSPDLLEAAVSYLIRAHHEKG